MLEKSCVSKFASLLKARVQLPPPSLSRPLVKELFGANLKQWQMANNKRSDFAPSVLYCYRNTIKKRLIYVL